MNNNETNGWYRLADNTIHSPNIKQKASELSTKSSPQTKKSDATKDEWQAGTQYTASSQNTLQNSQTVGPRGPVLIQDTALHEAMEDFANVPFLRRVVHTKGFGASGHFQVSASLWNYTSAGFLQDPSKQTQVAVRFSLAGSDESTPDTLRNIRGLSVKFYTDDGVFDLLCNSIPVFFVRDAIKVPETIASLAPSPINNLPDPNRLWGMFARTPEATNMLTWFFSDVGTAKSFRTISYHSVSTYVWKSAQGVRRYVKYHWIPVAGEKYIDQKEASQLACENPNIAGQDLYDTIASGKPVAFDLYVQLMTPTDESIISYDPLDDTKIWDEDQYPPLLVGRLTLDRNPDNHLEQVEKLAFAPANLVDGIEFSDDKILQGRAIVYTDAQRHRLGNDFRKIPVNRQAKWSPKSMTDSGNGRQIEGTIGRSPIPKQDDFTQAGQRYNSLSQQQKNNLTDNLAAGLSAASAENQRIILAYLQKASPDMASQVYQQMGNMGSKT